MPNHIDILSQAHQQMQPLTNTIDALSIMACEWDMIMVMCHAMKV